MDKFIYVVRRAKLILENEGYLSLLRKAFFKRLLNTIYYQFYSSKYPQNIIFIAGFAKAGTTWFSNMLSEINGFEKFSPIRWPLEGNEKTAMDLYPGIFNEFKNKLAIIKGHTWGTKNNIVILNNEYKGKYIVLVRDPRDALISAYWYIKKNPGHWDFENVSRFALEEFITYKLETKEFEKQFVGWLNSWIQNIDNKKNTIVRYEDLLTDTVKELSRIFRFLNFNIKEDYIRKIVKKHEFKNITGRQRGEEDVGQFNRKAIAGEYKLIFSDKQKEMARKQAKNVLKFLNYEL